MKVHLTFDVEIWCGGWDDLDRKFPDAFDRYVYGRSPRGEFALPATLEILQRHGLRATFFVEPLFSARFGAEFLSCIVRMIEAAGQEVQLHLHPEWTNEIADPPIQDASRKRQHLIHYSLEEQEQLLLFGLGLLRAHTTSDVWAFRAGNYAANADTYRALRKAGLTADSSLNRASTHSGLDVEQCQDLRSAFVLNGVQVYPITVFRDGLGRQRPSQVGTCGLLEMHQALDSAYRYGRRHFVIVSHNFEMLRRGHAEPDDIVVRRFEGLCQHLSSNRHRYDTCGFARNAPPFDDAHTQLPRVGTAATLMRVAAQVARRWG